MKRRELIRIFLGIAMTGATIAGVGCRKKEEAARTEPAETPVPAPTQTPFAETTPDESLSPEAGATDTAPSEPPAPYGELSDSQQVRVDAVMESLGEVNANEAKRWKENLAYDETGGERELQTWEAIAEAYKRWNDDRPGINDAAKQEAFNAILVGSLLPESAALRYVKLTALTPDDAKAAIALYNAPGVTNTEPATVPSPNVSPSPYFTE